jgi:transcriptional regulator with XRE-family HTH domain
MTLTPTHKRLIVRLKALREKAAFSQADLADKSGVSREYIARLETGHHDPSLTTLLKLAKALKVTVGKLVE